MSRFIFFACGCPVITAPSVDQTLFFPLYYSCTFVRDQLTVFMWLYFWAHCCDPLICLSLLSPVPHWNWLNVNLQPPHLSAGSGLPSPDSLAFPWPFSTTPSLKYRSWSLSHPYQPVQPRIALGCTLLGGSRKL